MIGRGLQRFARPPEIAELLSQYRTERERQELMERLRVAESQAAVVSLYEEEIDKLTEAHDRLAAELETQNEEIDRLTEERDAQSDQIRHLKYLLRTQQPTPEETEEEQLWPEPATLVDAVIQAQAAFEETLVFTRKAEDGVIRMNSADNSPARLWTILRGMDEVCRRWRTETLGMPFHMAFGQLGLTLKDVSDITKGRNPDSYCFTHKGERVSLGPHLQISRGERVYWYVDEEDRQFVINHIGQHLPDSTT